MHPFFELTKQLPELCFDGDEKNYNFSSEIFNEYLSFYQLNFSEDIYKAHFVGKFMAGDYQIAVQYWVPHIEKIKGTIFILHGYYDHVGLFQHIIEFILCQGYIVLIYDQPGHGLSSGERAGINSFAEYSEILSECVNLAKDLPKPWHVIAQSTGAAVVLYQLLVNREAPFEKNILLAPLIRAFEWRYRRKRWQYRILHKWKKSIARKHVQNSNDLDFVDFCHSDPLQSQRLMVSWVGAMKEWMELFPELEKYPIDALLIQGDKDDTVDWPYNIPAIEEKIGTKKTVYIEGARHHLVNESKDLRNKIMACIEQYLLASH